MKDTDLTSGGRLGSPAKDGGGGEMGNNKQGKKLISPAALERTTPNTAKHQGEVSKK